MYSEWLSLADTVKQPRLTDNVLRSFPSHVGQEVVAAIIKPLHEQSHGRHLLKTSEQVNWAMQVIGYGLTLPLSNLDLLTACSDVYRNWLLVLYAANKGAVPLPVTKHPDHYAQVMFDQLCALFIPREPEMRLLEDHALTCKQVIDTIYELISMKKLKMSRETWSSLLSFLLHVCDILLSPPPKTPSLGTSLCDVLIHTLFASWLKACHSAFPGPTMWKTLQEFCATWRHQPSLIEQWCRLMSSLTRKVTFVLYGSKHYLLIEQSKDSHRDFRLLLEGMPSDAVVQCWFRMLHTLKNPMDLLYQEVITDTQGFKVAMAEAELVTPGSSSGLLQSTGALLPKIFHTLMQGVTAQVFLFLGKKAPEKDKRLSIPLVPLVTSIVRASPAVRRSTRQQINITPRPRPRISSDDSFYINISPTDPKPAPSAPHTDATSTSHGIIGKPKGNTLLHVFGGWLFEAAVWTGQDSEGFPSRSKVHSSTTVISSAADLTRLQEAPSVSPMSQRVKEYEAGRAEVFVALCTIFSSQECGESVIPTYLARFYHSLSIGLQYDPHNYSGQVLTTIILHSASLFRKDLPAINVLVPYFISALDKILVYRKPQIYCDAPVKKLRHASIQLLLSMLPLPLHFIHLPLPDLPSIIQQSMEVARGRGPSHYYHILERRASLSSSSSSSPPTFYSLKNQLASLVFTAIETEDDDVNLQMLLYCLMAFIQDLVNYERTLTSMTGEYLSQVGRVADSEITTEDEEVSVITERGLPNDFSPTVLFQRAISAASSVLLSWASSPTNSVTLAALELLSGLAQLQFDAFNHNHNVCREAVQCVCDFIETQAQQKPYLQTKDLHTSIVAAFQTLLVWVLDHPHLLAHEGCLAAILRVVEFGVSGSFSIEDGSIVYKGEKQLKPVSGRVGEIAEFVLQCLIEKTGSFPSPSGPASSSSLLTEEEMLKVLPPSKQGKFHYFLVDNSTILGLLENSISNHQADSLPAVSVIMRGPSGRQVWSMQLRHHPRSANPPQSHVTSMERPFWGKEDPVSHQSRTWSPWPLEASQQAGLKLDMSIPVLGQALDDSSSSQQEEFSSLTKRQIEIEEKVNTQLQQAMTNNTFPDPSTAQEPPEIKQVFNTARLLLGHLGLLRVDSLSKTPAGNVQGSLSLLDSSCSSFRNALISLDRMPARFCDTVFVFYCQRGMSKVEELLSSQSLTSKPQEFVKFLSGLGWQVDPVQHPGFSGRLHPATPGEGQPVTITAQIPLRPFPYYADAMTEVAFVLPVLKPSTSDSTTSVRSFESSDSGQESASLASAGGDIQLLPPPPPHSFPAPINVLTWSAVSGSGVQESSAYAGTSDQDKQPALKKGSKSPCTSGATSQFGKLGGFGSDTADTPKRRSNVAQDCAVMVVWLEKFEDHLNFPAEPLSRILHRETGKPLKTGASVLPVIFIHRLASGLYQTMVKNEERAGPLIDGMVVSGRSLGVLVRQTAINLCSRHRMDYEGFAPPHVKRKKKIEEIGAAYSKRSTVASQYCDLLLLDKP